MNPDDPFAGPFPIDSGIPPSTGVDWDAYLGGGGIHAGIAPVLDGPSSVGPVPPVARPELDGGASAGPCPQRLIVAAVAALLGYALAPKSSRITGAAIGGVVGYVAAPYVCSLLGGLKGAGLGASSHDPRRHGRRSDY